MINILSYVGMNLQSEVCLWALLGLMRTIFDATLFKVNANLKQVWQMTMPEELTMPVQRVLRTMISGVMLVQCFTVYVYLASYIVLLYPVFLEERPTLVLPWLLLAAVRKLLCELTSLALGLGTCVLLGAARPPCIKFVVVKFTSIMPAFYMWMLVFSYYHALKVAAAFKTFPAVLPPSDQDYGLELAVRRRRTKSLLGEEQLRKKLVANYYGEGSQSISNQQTLRPILEISSKNIDSGEDSTEEITPVTDAMKPLTISTTGWSENGAYEDWFGNEVMIPRDTDRILEQIVLMLLRIGAYLKKERVESVIDPQINNSMVPALWNMECTDDSETPPLVGSSKGNTASYLREYPQIFMKKKGTDIAALNNDNITASKTGQSHVDNEEANLNDLCRNSITPSTSVETLSSDIEQIASKKKISTTDSKNMTEELITMPKQVKTSQTDKTSERKRQKKHKRKRNNSHSQDSGNEKANKIKNSTIQGNKVSWKEKNNNDSLDADSSRAINRHNSEQTSEETVNDEAEKTDTASAKKPTND